MILATILSTASGATPRHRRQFERGLRWKEAGNSCSDPIIFPLLTARLLFYVCHTFDVFS
jgi:hypothetical protein